MFFFFNIILILYLTLYRYLLLLLFFSSWLCSAISVELYYIFATAWGREHYTLYGILLCVFAILLSVGACISVALTYFLLSGEDYRWWWRSVLSTGSTGIFIFLYSLFYYHNRSNMSGLVQSVEFFGYSLLTAFVFSLMLGTVSFWASLAFIRYIYRSLKMDWWAFPLKMPPSPPQTGKETHGPVPHGSLHEQVLCCWSILNYQCQSKKE